MRVVLSHSTPQGSPRNTRAVELPVNYNIKPLSLPNIPCAAPPEFTYDTYGFSPHPHILSKHAGSN